MATNKSNKSDSSQFQDLKARIKSYENLKLEFYELNVDEDQKIDEYIKLFQQFNDEFLDAIGELGDITYEDIKDLETAVAELGDAVAKLYEELGE